MHTLKVERIVIYIFLEHATYKAKLFSQNIKTIVKCLLLIKKLKKSNEEDEQASKTAHEKWVEGYNYFLTQEGQDVYH